MNTKTGEMVELSEEIKKQFKEKAEYAPQGMFPKSGPTKMSNMATFGVGDTVDVTIQDKTVQCRVVYINIGKQRFTLHPLGSINYK